MIDGYLVKGEHIIAKSLDQAKKINAEHRAKALGVLLAQRTREIKKNEKLSKVVVSVEDSLRGGNCIFGTNEFKRKVENAIGHEITNMTADKVMFYAKKFGVEYYANRAVKAAMNR